MNLDYKYNVITSESGSEGLKLLENNNDVHLVVSDMRMPQMNGIEFISIAKEKYDNIAFFILTGFDINPEIEEALQKGLIDKYFSKPLDIDAMENAIEKVLGKK